MAKQRTNKHPPNTLVNLTQVQVYAATFVDGEGYADTRFVAVMSDGRIHMLHPEGMDDKIKQTAGWLKDQIRQQAPSPDQSGPAEVPESRVDVPMGSAV